MSHSGSSSSLFCQRIGVTATQVLPYRPILSRHYAGMTQDGLLIAGTLGEGGGSEQYIETYMYKDLRHFVQGQNVTRPPPPSTHSYPHPNSSDWPVGYSPGISSVSWRQRSGSTVLSGEPLIRDRGSLRGNHMMKGGTSSLCVFITAVPGGMEDMCYERLRAEADVN